jgi:hypothetical protein
MLAPRLAARVMTGHRRKAAHCVPRTLAGFLVFMLLRNLFGGGKQAPPPGMAFHPRVARGDPMSMRVFLNEQPTMVVDDLDAVSTAPVWQQTDFSLPLPAERSHVISYQPSKVRPVAGSGAVNSANGCCNSCAPRRISRPGTAHSHACVFCKGVERLPPCSIH